MEKNETQTSAIRRKTVGYISESFLLFNTSFMYYCSAGLSTHCKKLMYFDIVMVTVDIKFILLMQKSHY